MADDKKRRCGPGSFWQGPAWLIGWLFTLGYAPVTPFWWKGVLALVIWPYYLGQALAK